jgi:hypothetical protein
MSEGAEADFELKRLGMLHELAVAQLELIVEEQARQGAMLADIKVQLQPLREMHTLLRAWMADHQRGSKPHRRYRG